MSESEMKPSPEGPLFKDLQADETESEITSIESLCMRCGENGNTRILLTKIPFYKEVVLMSFSCPHCNWENNELQQAAEIQEEGVKYQLVAKSLKDLSRQVVKTEWATLKIPDLEFEIPARTQDGAITTIEGVISRTVDGLNQKLKIQKLEDGDTEYSKVLEEFISQLESLKLGETSFTFILEDPSGNSFVENLLAPQKDPQLTISHYKRTESDDKLLGIAVQQSEPNEEDNLNEEVLSFSTNCPNCKVPSETKMKVTQIPNFKEAIIMATNCSVCGHRTNEVKGGGGVERLGKRITLNLENTKDLMRDVLKSETCGISIPELELEVGSYALGGRFTTVEGLLVNFKEQLCSQNILIHGDSADEGNLKRMDVFLAKIDDIINGKMKVTVVLDDPCGNSYIENICTPDVDPQLKYEEYERTQEQNEELGFADMKTENYRTDV